MLVLPKDTVLNTPITIEVSMYRYMQLTFIEENGQAKIAVRCKKMLNVVEDKINNAVVFHPSLHFIDCRYYQRIPQ